MDVTLVVTHDGLKVAGFQNDTTPDQDNVVAAGQERDAVRDEDPSFCRKQSVGSDDVICEESVTRVTPARVLHWLTVNMTRDVGIDGG